MTVVPERKGFLGQVDIVVRTWGLVVIIAGAVAAYLTSRHDVSEIKQAWDKYSLETTSVLTKVNDSIIDLKVGQATLSTRVETLANSAAMIAASAVTQTQMQEHVRAADLDHAAMRKEVADSIRAEAVRIDDLRARVDRIERHQDGVDDKK